ncbi:Ycf3-interacting protein 1, chloroplastic [Ancistrocladus abbreviatus]
MTVQNLQLPLSSSIPSSILFYNGYYHLPRFTCCTFTAATALSSLAIHHCSLRRRRRRPPIGIVLVGTEEKGVFVGDENVGEAAAAAATAEVQEEVEVTPEDLEYVNQIKRVLELLKKNRDMLFGEVKLTIMIEDPREVERRRLLGIDDSEAPTREDLVDALEDVNEGRIPENRVALRMLAEEMINWPNLEDEAPRKRPKSRSPYAKATDTGVDPQVAAKRLNVDWDSAAEIEEPGVADDMEVPPAVGYGALYLVSAFPIIIGVSVVLILFYNSLQ